MDQHPIVFPHCVTFPNREKVKVQVNSAGSAVQIMPHTQEMQEFSKLQVVLAVFRALSLTSRTTWMMAGTTGDAIRASSGDGGKGSTGSLASFRHPSPTLWCQHQGHWASKGDTEGETWTSRAECRACHLGKAKSGWGGQVYAFRLQKFELLNLNREEKQRIPKSGPVLPHKLQLRNMWTQRPGWGLASTDSLLVPARADSNPPKNGPRFLSLPDFNISCHPPFQAWPTRTVCLGCIKCEL